MIQVEISFFDECPNVALATDRAREAIARAGAAAEVRLVRLDGEADAVSRRFLGSPTVRVDGLDVDEAAVGRTDFGLQCRVYTVEGRLEGAPPVAWIEAALRRDAGPMGSHAWEASYDYVINGLDIFDWKCRDCGMKARMSLASDEGSSHARPPFDPALVQLMAGGLDAEELLGARRHYVGHEELSKMTCSEVVAELVHHARKRR
jgi:hypothetical protein